MSNVIRGANFIAHFSQASFGGVCLAPSAKPIFRLQLCLSLMVKTPWPTYGVNHKEEARKPSVGVKGMDRIV